MSPVEKHLPYKTKVKKMYLGEFYLTRERQDELFQRVQEKSITQDRAAVEFIDQYGEWMAHGL